MIEIHVVVILVVIDDSVDITILQCQLLVVTSALQGVTTFDEL